MYCYCYCVLRHSDRSDSGNMSKWGVWLMSSIISSNREVCGQTLNILYEREGNSSVNNDDGGDRKTGEATTVAFKQKPGEHV